MKLPFEGRVYLSFLWVVPVLDGEPARVLSRDSEDGRLLPLRDPLRADWKSAETFLLEEADQRPDARYELRDDVAACIGKREYSCRVVLTSYSAFRSLTVLATISLSPEVDVLTDTDVDDAIALLQSLHGRRSETAAVQVFGRRNECSYPSMREAIASALQDLTRVSQNIEELERKVSCVELRSYDDSPAYSLASHDPRPIYGMATADEGWRFTLSSTASDRLGKHWGTRACCAIYSLGSGLVSINTKGADYICEQDDFTMRYFGENEPYFSLDADVAGLDHGALFVLERALVRLALADQWQRDASRLMGDGLVSSITRSRLLRSSLDEIIVKFKPLLPEIDPLEWKVANNMGLEDIVRRLDRQAEALDEDIRYDYERSTSLRITRLTIIVVILTVVTIALGILQVILAV